MILIFFRFQISCHLSKLHFVWRVTKCLEGHCLASSVHSMSLANIMTWVNLFLKDLQKKQKNSMVSVDEAWCSEDGYNIERPSNSNSHTEPSNVQCNTVTKCDTSNIKIGCFVLVRFSDKSQKLAKTHQFVGICHELDENDIKIMFL